MLFVHAAPQPNCASTAQITSLNSIPGSSDDYAAIVQITESANPALQLSQIVTVGEGFHVGQSVQVCESSEKDWILKKIS